MPQQRRWARASRDFLPVVLALSLCPLAALLTPARGAPLDRMTDLIDVERSLGLLFEPSLHTWVGSHQPLGNLLDFTYVGVHLPVTLGLLLWVWIARPDAFAFVRNTFVAAQTLCALGYLALPTAPPRMVAGLGYSTAPGPGDHGIGRLAQSPYAALPSAHTAFSLIVAGALLYLTASRVVRFAALVYPAAVMFEIYATGNHIWLDSVAGALCAGTGLLIALAIRARQEAPAGQAAPEAAASTLRPG
jgi:hypothetical protein